MKKNKTLIGVLIAVGVVVFLVVVVVFLVEVVVFLEPPPWDINAISLISLRLFQSVF